MPRYNKRRPRDHGLTRRRIAFAGQFNSLFPRLATVLTSYILDKTFLSANPGYKQEWKLIPAPPFTNVPGVINDDLMNRLMDGQVTNVSGVTRFTAAGIVTSDQDVVPVDVVIFATGSHFDCSILSDEANPTVFSSTEWDASEHNNDMKFPRLYKTLLSTRFPDTLAFIGPCRGFSLAAFTNSDLASQAIAQIWKGLYPIPNPSELEAWCDQNYMRALKQVRTWRISKTGSDPVEFERWLNEAAGNGVNEALGWGWQGWKFWWSERELYRLIVDGINTPFVYRLFSGRHGARTQWEGAREAIYKANGLTPK